MCTTTIRRYTREHRTFTIICLAVLAVSTALTALVLWNTTQQAQAAVEADGSTVAVHHIMLLDKVMSPDALSIHTGEYVQFNTHDGKQHEIGLGGGDEYGKEHNHIDPEFESGEFGVGDAYRVKFSKPGVYDFHDHLHPELFATVIVS